jgi:hypothetical protein
MLDKSYKVNSPGVIHDEIDSEVVIVDLNIGHYFRINKESSQLWNQRKLYKSNYDFL